MKYVIFSHTPAEFESQQAHLMSLGVSKSQITFCDSRQVARQAAFLHREWLMFLDADCFLTANSIQYLEKEIKNKLPQSSCCMAGQYLDPEGASYLQKVHNFIANTWLQHSYFASGRTPMLLGGCFAIYFSEKFPANDSLTLFWGAEDRYLALELLKAEVTLAHQPLISAIHRTNGQWAHLLRKAWLHGINEVKYCSEEDQRISVLFWIRKIGFSNLNLLPAILIHFCVQKGAMLFQRVRQMNKKYRLGKSREIRY